ncbi:MAG: hypothetical protein HXM41_01830 [Lachnospiraceae bacterium]|jgi:hypothetical protein|nr:hypothetical protein [Lachnospiraceae bacterium]RKW31014.1 MAG: hypothetical protein D8B43_07825 [Lachnoanaerobaculum sp.]
MANARANKKAAAKAAVVEKKVVAVKEAPKAEAPKAETKKVEPPKTETKKAAAPKKAVVTKVKAAVQFGGKDVDVDALVKQAKKAYKDIHKDVSIKSMDVYINADDSAAYFVVNGEEAPEIKINL